MLPSCIFCYSSCNVDGHFFLLRLWLWNLKKFDCYCIDLLPQKLIQCWQFCLFDNAYFLNLCISRKNLEIYFNLKFLVYKTDFDFHSSKSHFVNCLVSILLEFPLSNRLRPPVRLSWIKNMNMKKSRSRLWLSPSSPNGFMPVLWSSCATNPLSR